MEAIFEKWEQILQRVKEDYDIKNIVFDSWLKPLKICTIKDNILYIEVPSELGQIGINFISKRYKIPLKVSISEMTGIEYELTFVLEEQAKELKRVPPKKTSALPERSNLNPNYTFDTFVVGSNNRFAQSASLAVAESPGESYNPLYIYGGPGLGKTHLMHSIGNFILDQNPETQVLYVTSEEFTNEVIESIRNGNTTAMTKFREKYRTVDVLMIDDIQFIIGKESTQEEFFHTFNVLHSAKKQIILTSDKPPKEMETLEERIQSRFEWGLMADIGLPDYETRMAILRRKVESDEMELSDDILNYIANNIKSNIRELEGSLNKLIALYKLNKSATHSLTIDISLAAEALKDLISSYNNREVTPELILDIVADHFNITIADLKSNKRSANISVPRQIAMYLIRYLTETPLQAIGIILGGKDHSTIKYGVEKIEKSIVKDETLNNTINIIKKKINPA